MEEARDRRPLFAKYLQEMTDEMKDANRQPIAVYVIVHFEDGTYSRHSREAPGHCLSRGIGAFEIAKAELVQEVQRGVQG